MATGRATTLVIVGVVLLLALGGLAGTSMGLIGGDFVQGPQTNHVNVPPIDHAISYVAFCGDATDVTITDTHEDPDGEAAIVHYEASGGDITGIVYKAANEEFHIDGPDSPTGSFISGDGVSVNADNSDPCAAVGEDTIVKYEEYSSGDGWQESD